jgi:hypothetical protein
VATSSRWFFVVFALFSACDSGEIRTYRIPKETADVAHVDSSSDLPHNHPPLDAMALPEGHPPLGELPAGHPEIGTGMSMADAAANGLTPPPPPSQKVAWTSPPGWQEKPGSGFRYATFVVPGSGGTPADLSVTVLEGDAGGTLSNINRWRGQLGLDPLTPSQWAREEKTVRPAGRSMVYTSFANKTNRMTAAIYSTATQTWFFKLVGEDPVVRSAGADFMAFLESLRGL